MSEGAKARIIRENRSLLQERNHAWNQTVRLLVYVLNMQEDYPDLPWPELPDQYDESTWRAAA